MELREKLDAVFSKWVRLRAADYRGYVHCYTCSWIGNWRLAQCGHFVPRGNLATRFEPDNCRPQCSDCNEYHNGRFDIFEEELRDELGDHRVDELLATQGITFLRPEEWENDLFIHYSTIVKQLDIR